MWKTRHRKCELVIVLVCVSELLTVGLLLFSHGFLLTRQVIHSYSTCQDFKDAKTQYTKENPRHGNVTETNNGGCWMSPPFRKAIVVLIDALRYDFAVHNDSLRDTEALPYQNKMPVFQEVLKEHPTQARLAPFIADAPTTTMQRLMGITTGSLPTFIDSGSNFASEEIKEDNIIDQLVKQGRRITILGDDTWGGLFPGRFSRSHLYSSFNVMDLHSVDKGVLSHLWEEMESDGWQVIVAHFLGVDHCGHRYGPNHQQMAHKLTQMNQVIKQVISSMDNSTLLVVLGDHGMTQTGDHGGDSKEEIEAALFVYSPSLRLPSLTHPVPVAQVDIVPTLSLSLGVPVPFSSLGKVIEEVLVTVNMSAEEAETQRHLALYLNVQQVKRYLTSYKELGNAYPEELWRRLETLEKQSLGTSTIKAQKLAFSEYLTLAKEMCEEIWARFDVPEMSSGLCLMFSVLILAVFLLHCGTLVDIELHAIKSILTLTLTVNSLLALSLYFGLLILSYIGSLLILLWIYSQRASLSVSKLQLNPIDCISLSLVLVLSLGTFSNSYVIVENYVVAFVLASCLTLYLSSVLKAGSKKGSLFSGKILKVFGNVFTVTCVCGWVVGLVCVRCSALFWRCREEQYWCLPSLVQVPLSGLPQELHNWRYFTSVLMLGLIVWLPRRWLLLCGNVNGGRLGVMLVKGVPVFCCVLVSVWWAIQAVMAAHDIDIWEHILPPRIVCAVTLVYVLILVFKPLLIYELPPANTRRKQLVSDNPSVLIPQLCKNLMEKYKSRRDGGGVSIPVVYGLATSISASLVAVLMVVMVVVVLVAGDGLTPSVLLLLLIASASLLLHALWKLKTCHNLKEIVKPGWLAVCTWFTLSIHGFYTTGHQPTFPALHWSAAFVGIEGDQTFGNWAPALLVGLNTFSSPLLFGLSLPLLVLAPLALSVVFPSLRSSSFEGEEASRGEFLLVENPEVMRESLLSTCLSYILLQGVKVFFTSLGALILRRHLMLWKIFAPHFIFESLGFLVSLGSVLAGLGFTLRVHGALSGWSERILKST